MAEGGGISVYIGTRGAAIVLAVAAVAVAAVLTPVITGGGDNPGETSTANLWIDQNGGTCTRQGTAGAYGDAGACSTMQAAYLAASCGDIVGVKGGTAYTSQSVDTVSRKDCSSGSQYVTFKPATGENVVIGGSGVGTGGIDVCSGTWIKVLATRTGTGSSSTSNWTMLDNGTQGSSAGISMPSGGCGMGSNNWVHHLWFEGMVFENYISRGGDQVTLKNNNVESGAGASDHYDETIQLTNGYNGSFQANWPEDWVLDGNDFHGFTSELCRTGVVGGDNCHVECFTGEPRNITIRNNRFYDCGNTAAIIFSQDAGFSTDGTTNVVENNLIHDTENIPLQFGDMESGSVVTVRNNTIRTGGGGGQATSDALGGSLLGTVNFIGNVLEGGNGISCGTLNGTWTYNVMPAGGSGCGTGGTGNQFSTSTTFLGVVPEYRLGSSQTARDLIPSGSCPTSTDLDGTARPQGSACDAGADEG